MGIGDEYIAYSFDEVCYFYLNECTDEKGKINWNKIKWDKDRREKKKTNKDFIEFIQKHG